MSSGGSAGDAGSTSQEATAPEDYTSDYGYATADEGYADVSSTSTTTDSGSSGFEGSPEMGGSRVDTTAPDTSYDAGGQDPGVPSPYTDVGTKAGSYINPNDTGSNIVNNARANIASATSTPTGTLGTVFRAMTNPVGFVMGQTVTAAYQTAKFNNAMGRPMTQGLLETDGLVTVGTDNKTIKDTMQEISDSSDNVAQQVDAVRTVDTASTGLPEPSSFIFNDVGSKNYIQNLYTDIKGILTTPRTTNGLLAVSESPYYDFLKSRNLNRRVL